MAPHIGSSTVLEATPRELTYSPPSRFLLSGSIGVAINSLSHIIMRMRNTSTVWNLQCYWSVIHPVDVVSAHVWVTFVHVVCISAYCRLCICTLCHLEFVYAIPKEQCNESWILNHNRSAYYITVRAKMACTFVPVLAHWTAFLHHVYIPQLGNLFIVWCPLIVLCSCRDFQPQILSSYNT